MLSKLLKLVAHASRLGIISSSLTLTSYLLPYSISALLHWLEGHLGLYSALIWKTSTSQAIDMNPDTNTVQHHSKVSSLPPQEVRTISILNSETLPSIPHWHARRHKAVVAVIAPNRVTKTGCARRLALLSSKSRGTIAMLLLILHTSFCTHMHSLPRLCQTVCQLFRVSVTQQMGISMPVHSNIYPLVQGPWHRLHPICRSLPLLARRQVEGSTISEGS